MPVRALLAVAVIGSAGLLASGEAQALRCGSRVVDRGALDVQVVARCGEPYWRTSRAELFVRGEAGPVEQRIERRIEDWYYNFGSSRLVVRLRFIDGALADEQTLGYGQPGVGGRCTATALQRGLSEGEVVLRCGPPRPREEWLLRRDDSRFIARVLLSDGRVESVENVRP